jgi:predicted metalloprotease with PDZ domain
MHYKVSISNPSQHFIQLTLTVDYIHQDTLHLQLPSWRPGRYELQNYAKNIRCLSISDENGNVLSFKKITKDCWEVETCKVNKLILTYEYYANQYDAGASYVDEHQLYINPVNCMMYVVGRMDEEYFVELDVPDTYLIACQLPTQVKSLHAKNFDELADSPLIASATLQHSSFIIQQATVHFWFQGNHQFDMERLTADTKKYIEKQIELFGDLPLTQYHFLYPILETPFRHGVEHCNSTVIAMGKLAEQTDEDFYQNLLAISSHEFFHLWNVKRIRPAEMFPYDFTKENYSTLGYVYEGVTTYYGDLMLLRSGVWNWEQYNASFNSDLKRHVDNLGRYNYSVAESSFDTWLDGYVQGVSGRKVSIYIEGMLAAFIADVLIIKHSERKYSLDDVMKDLYQNFYKHGKGYTQNDYKSLLEKYSGISFDNYFKEIIFGKNYFEKYLKEIADYMGCKLLFTSAQFVMEGDFSTTQNELLKKWKRLNN